MKKYRLTDETMVLCGRTLHRIQALRDIPFYNVQEGDFGGWVEKEENLSHEGACWVRNEGKVYEDAWVYGDALVGGIANVYGRAKVFGEAQVLGNVQVFDNALIFGCPKILGNVIVNGDVWITD